MPEREKAGRKAIEEVQRLRARVVKLERIALRKAGPKDADRELDRAWSEWETTFDAIGDSVILLDSKFNIVQANAATSSLLGKPLDEIVGQRCCKLVHGSNKPLEDCPLIKTKTTKKREKAEFYIAEKDIWALVSVDPILDEQGNLTGAVHIIRDITERRKAEHALGESEERFRKVFEDGPMGMVMADPGTARFVRANGVFCRMLGYTEEELQRMTFLDITHPEHREQDEKQVKKLWAGEIPFYKAEKRYICKNREVLWGALTATVVCGADGKPLYSLAMVEDITERKKATDGLIRLTKILKTVARVNQDIFLIKDRKELLRSVCSRIVGHPYKMVWIGFCDEPTKTVVPAAQAGFDEGYLNSTKVTYDDSEYGRGPTGTAIRTNKPCVVRSTAKDPTYQPWRKEALKRGYRSSAAIPVVSGKRVIGALNVYSEKEDAFGDEEIGLLEELVRDISTGLRAIDEEDKRKQAEKKLKTYQAELKSLASELLLTEERERRRIAAGIHDDIGQKLALAKMELQLLARPPGNSRIPASLDSVCARIDEVIKDAHSLTFELSNPALYDLRFAAAIDLWLLERIQKKHGIKCTVIADEQGVPLAENSKVVLFRALRELAVNVVKHAKATALTVTIEKLEGSVQITCKDDGLGFTPPKGGALPSDVGGFGLFNIKERLEYLGGSMKLESAPGRGTLITLSLPLERQNDAGADEGRQ